MSPEALPEPPSWVPLERYGVGIPFVLIGAGLGLLVYAAGGVQSMSTLTGYGKIGLAVVVIAGVLLVAAAGYTYSAIDNTWWLETEDEALGEEDG